MSNGKEQEQKPPERPAETPAEAAARLDAQARGEVADAQALRAKFGAEIVQAGDTGAHPPPSEDKKRADEPTEYQRALRLLKQGIDARRVVLEVFPHLGRYGERPSGLEMGRSGEEWLVTMAWPHDQEKWKSDQAYREERMQLIIEAVQRIIADKSPDFPEWSHGVAHLFEKYGRISAETERSAEHSLLGYSELQETSRLLIEEVVRRAIQGGTDYAYIAKTRRVIEPLYIYNLQNSDPQNLDAPFALKPDSISDPKFVELLVGYPQLRQFAQARTPRELLNVMIGGRQEKNLKKIFGFETAELAKIVEAYQMQFAEEGKKEPATAVEQAPEAPPAAPAVTVPERAGASEATREHAKAQKPFWLVWRLNATTNAYFVSIKKAIERATGRKVEILPFSTEVDATRMEAWGRAHAQELRGHDLITSRSAAAVNFLEKDPQTGGERLAFETRYEGTLDTILNRAISRVVTGQERIRTPEEGEAAIKKVLESILSAEENPRPARVVIIAKALTEHEPFSVLHTQGNRAAAERIRKLLEDAGIPPWSVEIVDDVRNQEEVERLDQAGTWVIVDRHNALTVPATFRQRLPEGTPLRNPVQLKAAKELRLSIEDLVQSAQDYGMLRVNPVEMRRAVEEEVERVFGAAMAERETTGLPWAKEVRAGQRPETPEELEARERILIEKLVAFLTPESIISGGHTIARQLMDESGVGFEQVLKWLKSVQPEQEWDDFAVEQWIKDYRRDRKAGENGRVFAEYNQTTRYGFEMACKAFAAAKRAGKRGIKVAYFWDSMAYSCTDYNLPEEERQRLDAQRRAQRDRIWADGKGTYGKEAKEAEGYPLALPREFVKIAQRHGIKPKDILALPEHLMRNRTGRQIGFKKAGVVLDETAFRQGRLVDRGGNPVEKKISKKSGQTYQGREIFEESFVRKEKDEDGNEQQVAYTVRYVEDDDNQRVYLTEATGAPSCRLIANGFLEAALTADPKSRKAFKLLEQLPKQNQDAEVTRILKQGNTRLVNIWQAKQLRCTTQGFLRVLPEGAQSRVMEIYIDRLRGTDAMFWTEPEAGAVVRDTMLAPAMALEKAKGGGGKREQKV